jgi:hypothetical protein
MIFIANILALIFNMTLTYLPFELQLKHPFTIAKFSRTSTPLMLLQIEHEGYTGYGEASMVPYMGESHQTAINFLKTVEEVSSATLLILKRLQLTWIASPPAILLLKRLLILPCMIWMEKYGSNPVGNC